MPTTIDRRTRRKRGSINKRVILDASAAMFHEKGYDRTTLDDIAGLLSVTKPSLYYYFANKEDILLGCISAAYEGFMADLAEHDDPRLTGRQRVEIFLRRYLDVVTRDIGVSMVLADDRVMADEGRDAFNGYRRSLNRALEERVKQGVADGSIVTDETKLTTYALFGMFNWVGHWNFRQHRITLDTIFDRFAKLAFEGIGARPPGS